MDSRILSVKTNRYIENSMEMRKLSSPDIGKVQSAEEYFQLMQQNHVRVAELADENKSIMDEYISPLLADDKRLPEELVVVLSEFCEKLLDVFDMVDVDLAILVRVSDRLLWDARQKSDADYLVTQLDLNVIANYAMMNQLKRNVGEPGIWKKFQENGLRAADDLLKFMEKDAFLQLKEASSRERVLITTRYFCTLYDNDETTGEEAQMIFERLKEAYELAQNPFYVENAPDYDWNRHCLKALEYMGQLTESNNLKSCSKTLCEQISVYMHKMERLFSLNPEKNKGLLSRYMVSLLQMRADYFAGKTNRETYMHMLTDLYDVWVMEDNPVYAIYCYDLLPLEYISLLDRNCLTELEKSQLDKMYQNALNFALSSECEGSLSFFLEYFMGLLYAFIEIPESMNFESLVLDCFAAIYPPAYVHALMSAKLARCLCEHLIHRRPELFLGIQGMYSAEEIEANRDGVIRFAYHSALMHDVGRLAMIETMMVHGRNLMEEEQQSILCHPRIGYELVKGKHSVELYKNIILGHHRSYDNEMGYPKDFDTWELGEKTVLDIVSCVDVLAHFVDFRNENEDGLESILSKITEERGRTFAPFFSWLFSMPEVVSDIRYLLTKGQEEAYRETYIRIHEIATKKERTFF